MDIVTLLAAALRVSPEELFRKAVANEEAGKRMLVAYRDGRGIPNPVLAHCRGISVCVFCGRKLGPIAF